MFHNQKPDQKISWERPLEFVLFVLFFQGNIQALLKIIISQRETIQTQVSFLHRTYVKYSRI